MRGLDYRFVGLSLSPLGVADYVKAHNVEFPVYTNVVLANGRKINSGETPQTILMSRDGRVQKSWAGAYTGKIKGDVEAALKAQLPGISEAQATPH